MEKILGAILIGGFALLFFVLGYLVWIKEKITLFHSYHYDKVAEENKKAFCKLSGIGLIVIGIGVLLAGIICSATSSAWGGIAIAIGFLFGLMMLIYAGLSIIVNKEENFSL